MVAIDERPLAKGGLYGCVSPDDLLPQCVDQLVWRTAGCFCKVSGEGGRHAKALGNSILLSCDASRAPCVRCGCAVATKVHIMCVLININDQYVLIEVLWRTK